MSSDFSPVQEEKPQEISTSKKGQKIGRVIRTLVFSAGFVFLFVLANRIAEPYWTSNYDPVTGFYEEPSNTIETVFLGTSHVKAGISPMELYEQYGICSYDLGTDGQPVLASYFWLVETYAYHADTLTTVVFDVSGLRSNPLRSGYQQALDYMKFSRNKWQAVKSYSASFTEFTLDMVPIFSFHERWKELTETDFAKLNYDPDLARRGYLSLTDRRIDREDDYTAIHTPLLMLDETEENLLLDEDAVRYFEMMVTFCQNHNLNLVLIMIPTGNWTSGAHNAVQEMADRFNLDFLDFNFDPYYSDMEFNMASDMIKPTELENDNLHLNHYGAVKFSDYLGEYLVNECGNRDVRGDERYAFMEEELAAYQRETAEVITEQYLDPCDFLAYALEEGEYIILISAKEDASAALTDAQREWFADTGFLKLSKLSANESYLAIIDEGNVVTELSKKNTVTTEKFRTAADPLAAEGTLSDGRSYYMESGGIYAGNVSSVQIDGTEWSGDEPGLNIVLYDKTRRQVTVSANFDTSISSERESPSTEERLAAALAEGTSPAALSGKERELFLYNRRCDNEKMAQLVREDLEEDGFFTALSAYSEDEHFIIYLTAQSDSMQEWPEEVKEECLEKGLSELSELSGTDSYAAVIKGGEVLLEERDSDGNPVEVEITKGLLRSCGQEGSEDSFVMIDGEKYTAESGLLFVVYDEETELVVDVFSFNTNIMTP